MEHPHPSPAPRTDTTLRAIAETNAQNDPRHIVQTTEYPGVPPKVEYSVSQIGEAFYPVLDSLEAFGNTYTQWKKQQTDEKKQEIL